jgi:hypothetical protein
MMEVGRDALPWWYDLAKWGLTTAVAVAMSWAIKISAKAAKDVKVLASVELVDKHDLRIRALEDTSIRVDMRLGFIESGIKQLLSK